jgi:hypothetical protein
MPVSEIIRDFRAVDGVMSDIVLHLAVLSPRRGQVRSRWRRGALLVRASRIHCRASQDPVSYCLGRCTEFRR